MLRTAKIKIRDIKELQEGNTTTLSNGLLNKTPLRKRKSPRNSATICKKIDETDTDNKNVINDKSVTRTKVIPGTAKKFVQLEQPSTQKRIDCYFTACHKTFQIKDEPPTTSGKNNVQLVTKEKKSISTKASTKKRSRKRLFAESTADTTISGKSKKNKNNKKIEPIESILISDDEDDHSVEDVNKTLGNQRLNPSSSNKDSKTPPKSLVHVPIGNSKSIMNAEKNSVSLSSSVTSLSKTNDEINSAACTAGTINNSTAKVSRRKVKPCPPYKVIENTTFAVDAFQFGYIENVTHYFLTHFHADHYIGLTKSFAKPIYMSPITARFVRTFIRVEEEYIHVLELNQTYTINNIEVTALDANHCPGSVMLVFKLLNTGKCILHTGDFKAWHGMESEPIFWNNDIHTIYLDTTYLSDKYSFCTQFESMHKAKELIDTFQGKHEDKRILFICGSYVIGKEKFWSVLASFYKLKVWAEGNRYKALKVLNDEDINELLVETPNEADMHIIAMVKLSYMHLLEYFKKYEHTYDMVFAIRPSGWEKNSKPQYRGKINIVGIEYSEHSSYDEMKRFVKFLKPKKVLSTVPVGRDLMTTAEVPSNWYKYDKLKSSSNYQPTITTYLKQTAQGKAIRTPNIEMNDVEHIVSPLKLTNITENSPEKNQIESAAPLTETSKILQKPNNTECNSNENCTLKRLTANSSEEFEKADITLIQKRPQPAKRKLQENDTSLEIKKTNNCRKVQEKSNKIIQNTSEKTKSNEEALSIQKQNKTYTVAVSESVQTRRKSLRNKKKIETSNTINVKQENILSKETQNSTTLESFPSNFTNTMAIKQEQILSEEPTSLSESDFLQRYKVKSNKRAIKTSNEIYTSEEDSANMAFTSAYQNKALALEEIPFPDKNNYKSIPSSSSSKNQIEMELQSITNQNDKGQRRKITQKTLLKNSVISQKNPILKSTTTTSITSTSTEEIPASQSTNNLHQNTDRPLKSKYSKTTFNAGEFVKKENCNVFLNKSQQDLTALSQCLTPLKNSNQPLDTKVILKTIMENCNDLEKFNCTQLAGIVVETLNENKTDNSRDHIPADLLSDTDDKSVSDHTSINSANELPSSSFNEEKSNFPTYLLSDTDNKTLLNHITHISELPSSSLAGGKNKSLATSSDSLTSFKKSNESICIQTNKISELPSTSLSGRDNVTSLTSIAHKLTPLKNSKKPLNTKALIKSIMETKDQDFSNINCTQLAGLMVETINEQNPDDSKDHIPVDLLSDADDDWI